MVSVPAVLFLFLFIGPGREADQDELDSRVDRLLPRLRDDDPEARSRAARELIELGRRALPFLERHLKADNLEARGQVASVIKGIYGTDPYFVVRPRTRRVSVDLVEVAPKEALAAVFAPFPVRPWVDPNVIRAPEDYPVTLKLEDATFWEAVVAFEKASRTYLDLDTVGFAGYEPEPVDNVHSAPAGQFMATAKSDRDEEGVTIEVEIHPEPGLLLLSAEGRITAIEDSLGRDVFSRFAGERKEITFNDEEFSLHATNRGWPEDSRLTLRGRATIRIPRRIEAAQYFASGFRGPVEKRVGPYGVKVSELKQTGASLSASFAVKGPRPAGAGDDSLAKTLWLLVADAEGPSDDLFSFIGGTSGKITFGYSAKDGRTPTRLVALRILETETVEISFRIENIRIPLE